MRLRDWIGIVAAMAVFWHGVLVVRHSLAMADGLRHYRALIADMTSLCRTRPGEASTAVPDQLPAPLPFAPRPDDVTGCLVCAGLVSVVLPSPEVQTAPGPIAPAVGCAAREAQRVSAFAVAHPPARGPPFGA